MHMASLLPRNASNKRHLGAARNAGKVGRRAAGALYARLHRCRELCGGYIIRDALDRTVHWRYMSVNPIEFPGAGNAFDSSIIG